MKVKTGKVAGVDVGAGTVKIVVLDAGQMLSFYVQPVGYDAVESTWEVTRQALSEAQVSLDELEYIVSTGYGRGIVPFASKTMSEIMCHAKGVHFLIPDCRTVIDIGCQDSKVIRVDEEGNVTNFVMNDKCAAGTGRFIEVMADVLRLDISELGAVALTSKAPCVISSTCTVFAETEVVALRGQGRAREDLVAGVINALAKRISVSATSVRPVERMVLTGGVAKNIGLKVALSKELGVELLVPEEPQITGALGAALYAMDQIGNR